MTDLFIERSFINEYFSTLKWLRNNFFYASSEKTDLILRFNKIFFNKNVRYKNISNVKPEELREYMFRKLMDSDQPDISHKMNFVPNPQNPSPFSFNLISNDQDSKRIRRESNCQTYNVNDLLNSTISSRLFTSSTYNIKSELKNWGSLAEKTLRFKFIVINDAYLFLNRPNALFEMLELLLKKSGIGNINVFVNTSRNAFLPNGPKLSEQNERELISAGLKKYSEDLNLKFPNISFCITVSKYHKRIFFTNCQFVHSDNSFSSYFDADEAIRIDPFLFYDETHKTLGLYRNMAYMETVLNKISSAKIYSGNRDAVNGIIEDLARAGNS